MNIAKIIDGKILAEVIMEKSKNTLEILKNNYNIKSTVTVILIGNNKASLRYIRIKRQKCNKLGIDFHLRHIPHDVDYNTLKQIIIEINEDPQINAIILQMPLPDHLAEYMDELLSLINPLKDADGLTQYNSARLPYGTQYVTSCTPKAIMLLLESVFPNKNNTENCNKYHNMNADIEGKYAVVVGRSRIVGHPVSELLLSRNCTVTITHSKTINLEKYTQNADILIVATGKAHLINDSHIKHGACVIDVGINDINEKLVGDVDFDSVSKVAGYISPVPGGVGPMTVACLIDNITHLTCLQNSILY